MKKIIFVVLVLLLNSCIPYKSYIKKDTECDFDMTIYQSEKVLDSELQSLFLKDADIEIDSGNFILSYYETYDKHCYINKINK